MRIDLNKHIGSKFNRLTVTKLIVKHERKYFLCKCDCGNFNEIKTCHVIKGKTKSCGCWGIEVRKLTGKANKGRRLPNALAAKRVLYGRYGSDIRGHEFALKFEDFIGLTSKNCFYCDIPPHKLCRPKKSQQDGYLYNGLDRLNNNVGYIIGNVVPCCFICNTKKGTMSVDSFYEWILKIVNNKGLK